MEAYRERKKILEKKYGRLINIGLPTSNIEINLPNYENKLLTLLMKKD